MGKKVVVAGHLCVDITPAIQGAHIADLGDFLVPGSLIDVGPADIHTGGAVTNTGLAMRFFGMETALAGAVGMDALGDIVTRIMEGHGAADGLIHKADGSTSYSVVLAIPGVDRIFLHHPGVNDSFGAEDIPEETLLGAALMHFGYPPAMRRMYQGDGDQLVAVLRRALDAGAATSLDLSGVDENSEAGRADWRAILGSALPFTDIFVPSAEELMFMLDRERFHGIAEETGGGDFCARLDIDRDIRPLAERSVAMGAGIALIKCGPKGMVLKCAGVDRLEKISSRLGLRMDEWADLEIYERSYKPDRVLSGTGAGDTSIAAFLTAILKGYRPERAVQLAAATGACCLSAYDALSGLKPFAELERRIDSGWPKLEATAQ